MKKISWHSQRCSISISAAEAWLSFLEAVHKPNKTKGRESTQVSIIEEVTGEGQFQNALRTLYHPIGLRVVGDCVGGIVTKIPLESLKKFAF